MKCYHLIYNSSERSIKGAPGFGIHTYSEDLPKDVLAAIEKDPELFAFQYKGVQLTPNTLNSNPDSITGIIPTWIYSTIPVGEGRKAHVLGRKIAVGFDYSFYKTGQPTRLGNYVGDYYITLDTPSADFWNLMYTRKDGIQFLPISPIPTMDNEDMRTISLGDTQLLLPLDEFEVSAPQKEGISDWALEIVFAILESRKQQKPLLVKMPSVGAENVMADVFRILPSDVAVECPFTTNYHQMGRRQGYNIFVINEAYQGQIMAEQWLDIDLINGKLINSSERNIFLPILRNYAERGLWDYAKSAIMWILSDAYANMGNCNPKLNSFVLSYLNNDEFDFENLPNNEELIKALTPILQNNEDKRDYLLDYLWDAVKNITSSDQINKMSQDLKSLSPLGADIIAEEWKPNATKIVFESIDSFMTLYKSVRGNLNSVTNVVDFTECVNHEDYLGAFAKHPDIWRILRPLFIPKAEENLEAFVLLILKEEFSYEDFVKSLEEVDNNKTHWVDSLISIYEKTVTKQTENEDEESVENVDSDKLNKIALKYLAATVNSLDYYPFIERVPDKYDVEIFSRLYLWDIQKNLERKLNVISINDCMNSLLAFTKVLEKNTLVLQEVQKLSKHFYAIMAGEIVYCLNSAYSKIITNSQDSDDAIKYEIDTLVETLGICIDDIKKNANIHKLTNALNSMLITSDILQGNISNLTESHINKAIEFKRSLYLRLTLPIVLSQQLNSEKSEFVAKEYVNCGAITANDLLKEVQKNEYKHNQKAIWTAVLHNLGCSPNYLVQKIAGLYEEPDAKGKYSSSAIERALHFMQECMPEEYEVWDRSNNSPIRKILRAFLGVFRGSSKKVSPEKTSSKENRKKKDCLLKSSNGTIQIDEHEIKKNKR